MQELLNRLSDNFDVEVYQTYENKLHQQVARVIICDKGFSIVQPITDEDKYEIVYTAKVESGGIMLPFTSECEIKTVNKFNLTSEEVIEEITNASASILQKLINNPILAKHGISV